GGLNLHSAAGRCFVNSSMNFSKEVFPPKSAAHVPGPAPLGGGRVNVAGWQSSRILKVEDCPPTNSTAPPIGAALITIRLKVFRIVALPYSLNSARLNCRRHVLKAR